jgi:FMN-dependent NADH-azoreductase
MPHLLHIDSSIQGDASVSRALSARARERWLAANPGGTVTYQDFGAEPVPHFTTASGIARMVPADVHTPEQAASWALSVALIAEIQRADTLILGLPLYNFGPPSTIKSWVDHLIAPGISLDPETHEGLLTEKELIVLAARGGGYGPGTPRDGWDHAEPWLPHGLSLTGLVPRFITAELQLAYTQAPMAELIPLADASRAAAEAAIDELWVAAAA